MFASNGLLEGDVGTLATDKEKQLPQAILVALY